MNKYAIIAQNAATLVQPGSEPSVAWETASCQVFTPGSASQKKGCPKNAFLGLYGGTGKNATYAQKALQYLRQNPNTSVTPFELWNIVLTGESKCYNSQMDVVLAAYKLL